MLQTLTIPVLYYEGPSDTSASPGRVIVAGPWKEDVPRRFEISCKNHDKKLLNKFSFITLLM